MIGRLSPRLLVLTDRHQLPSGRDLVDQLERLARLSARGVEHLPGAAVVLRELDLDDACRAVLAERIAGLGWPVLAAHRPLPGCVGVHLPASAPAGGSQLAWGRSCHDSVDLRRAAQEGAGWATLSPFAVSASKPGHGPPLPSQVWADLPLPTFALGGVDEHNAAAALAAGAHGVAVMGALMRAEDAGAVLDRLLEAIGAEASR